MTQTEAVIKVMKSNGGFATLGFLNQEALKVEGCKWLAKDPFANIRRIVQDNRIFFKIRPGLWALKACKDKLPPEISPSKAEPTAKQEEYNHTYYQGLLVELGDLKKFKTFVPNQDKNKSYIGKRLCDITTVPEIFNFGYDNIVQRAKTIDVGWFNERNMPATFFEIEHSTNIQNSLIKFVELQDFNVNFFIVADVIRERDYKDKLRYSAFSAIQNRTKFMSYDHLSDLHAKTCAMVSLEKSIGV